MGIRSKLSELKQHQGFMKYFKNTSWLFAEKILRMSVGLFVGIWIARYLGPEQFGLFSYAQSFVALFTAFATLGLDSIVIRELVKDKNRRDLLLGTAFVLKLIGAGIVLVLLAFVTSLQNNDSLTNTLIFIIASGTLFQSFNVIDFYFQSKVLSKFVVFSNTISLLVSSIIKIYLLLNEAPLIAFAYVGLFDGFVLSCGFIYFYFKNNLSIFKWSFDFNIAKSLLKDSWPLVFSSAVLMIQARVDQIMLKDMIGVVEVGNYSVALKLIESFAFTAMILKMSLFPSIQKAKSKSEQLYHNRLLNYYRLSFLSFLLVAIPLFFYSEQIVNLLFGSQYTTASVLLSLMSIRIFFANMGVARGAYLLSENLMRFSLLTMILGTITNVILNYFLIAEYAGVGAVWATIFSFSVSIFLVDIFYVKTRKNVSLQIKGIFTFYRINIKGS